MSRSDRAALVFTLLYLGAAVPAALATGNQEFVFYVGVLALLVLGVGAIHLRIRFHAATIWALSIWGFLHLAGGLLPVSPETGVLYNLWLLPGRLKYDQVVHAYGFGIATWACWQALRRRLAAAEPTSGLLVLVALAGLGLGALNEVVEFAATRLMPETNVGGYENTGWDLVANLAGAVTAAVLIRLRRLP